MRKYRSLAVLLVLVLLLAPILASCGVSPEDDRTVLTVDGKEVSSMNTITFIRLPLTITLMTQIPKN